MEGREILWKVVDIIEGGEILCRAGRYYGGWGDIMEGREILWRAGRYYGGWGDIIEGGRCYGWKRDIEGGEMLWMEERYRGQGDVMDGRDI